MFTRYKYIICLHNYFKSFDPSPKYFFYLKSLTTYNFEVDSYFYFFFNVFKEFFPFHVAFFVYLIYTHIFFLNMTIYHQSLLEFKFEDTKKH